MAIAVFVLSPDWSSSASPPEFTYGVLISLFAFFTWPRSTSDCSTAHSRWTRYLFGERIYILLTLTPRPARSRSGASRPPDRQIARWPDTDAASLLRTGTRVTCLG
jgi:hypothetical protein